MAQKLSESRVYGGRLNDRDELLRSSSGGAFTALSDVFLKNENAIVCPKYNYETQQQEFSIIEIKEDRDCARGSVYVQSIPGDIFRTALEWLTDHPEKELLFVGTGCQAAGFKKYAAACGLQNSVTFVDIICHGSSSPKIWKEFITKLSEGREPLQSLSFRDKRNGWAKPTGVAKFGEEEVSLSKYMKIYYSKKAMRPSCYQCPYTSMERGTDITIGDFWHMEEKHMDQYDSMGTSLFLIHSEKGMKLFEECKNDLIWFESNTSNCWQWNLEKPTEKPADYDQFWADYNSGGIEYIVNKYANDSYFLKTKKILKRIALRIVSGGG